MPRIAIPVGSVVLLAIVRAGFACDMTILIWQMSGKSADPLFPFFRNEKVGYMDASGRIVMKPSLQQPRNYYREFHEGLLPVEGKGGSRLIDRTGATVALSLAEWVGNFSEGLAVASPDLGKFGFIDRTGRFVISPQFYAANSFSEGLAKVSLGSETGAVGYIDRQGNFVIEPHLGYGWDFHEGVAAAVMDSRCRISNGGSCARPQFKPQPTGADSDCRYSYIDKTGKPIFRWRFDDAKDFSEGLAAVRTGEKWGFVNKRGEMMIAAQFSDADSFSEGLALVWKDDAAWFVDHSGKEVIAVRDGRPGSFSDGRSVVSGPDRRGGTNHWYIDKSGKRAFPGDFVFATSFVHGRAHVRIGDKFAWIDTSGKAVFTYSAR